ncbi:MAG: UDP-3-O-(3-hydroxymyristoyl)glucosamine N-acyltransferase [Pirellulaceae bacterium]|nr:UDP-3-O-(3-hydroxymyristoyl)glucosamine N-acyltransferase [Pirellulaceae bacterium]
MIQLSKLAQLVGGTVIGDDTTTCLGANPPGVATGTDITMLADPSQASTLLQSQAVAVVTTKVIDSDDRPQLIVEDPHDAFAAIVSHFRPPIQTTIPGVGVDSSANIAPSAKIHPTVTIGAGVVIGERSVIMPGVVILPHSKIGNDCVLHANVTLYEYSQLGDRVVLHANTTIGAHGFGYRQKNGRHVPTAQLGYVSIESDVETGAGVTIDRGTYGVTRIGEGTKIDNQVQVAHNCNIGRHNLLCSQVGIAGSCTTGDYVILAGQVGVKDHIQIADKAIICAQSGIMHDCDAGETYMGSPAIALRDQMTIYAIERRLPEMRRELKALRREMDALSASHDDDAANETKRAA